MPRYPPIYGKEIKLSELFLMVARVAIFLVEVRRRAMSPVVLLETVPWS